MPRRNHSRRISRKENIRDKYDTDFMELPERPEIKYLVAKPTKVIYRNMYAAPGATKIYTARSFNDNLLQLISRRRWEDVS